ncbi:uncharacterized protein M421DRAFT_789 [Didymella exigua CBS 183.55]|uniref:Uncharacterized protein n=1 Tax=Didymella exigua CBS 183.55 TaxID=1150837 RepID=A0A6A5S1P5_9PLEO|nr:uncharacterized protein M421DRAFT_789 [Didymella exigua CBS 183.55]KAF1933374.1 hypothetical protein M421DRAFT_789 [Didymella exigua CBS 183.55]
MADEDRFAVRGNTRTIQAWHLNKSLLRIRDEAERKAALEAEAAAKVIADLRQRYKSTSAEREESHKAWRKWLASRSDEGAPPLPDFVTGWRDFVPAAKPKQEKVASFGEARFGKQVSARHDKCFLCEAIETTRADPELPCEDKRQRLQRLEHTIPKLIMGRSTAPGVQDGPTFDNLVSVSAWGHESSSPGQVYIAVTAVSNEGLLRNALNEVGSIESTLDTKKGQHGLSRTITRFLVESAPGDTEIMDRLINDKVFRQHSEAVRQRVNLYRANRDAALTALIAASCDKRLSLGDIETASKAKADALELERDLAKLKTSQKAYKARIELVRIGQSVPEYSRKWCEMRRHRWRTGIDRECEELENSLEVDPSFRERDPFELIKRIRWEYQEERSLPGTPPPAEEATALSNHSLTPPALTELPEPQNQGPGPSTKTLQEINRRTREQEDNTSVSTDGDPFALEKALDVVPKTQDTARPGSDMAATYSPKGKDKKDSKVESLLGEDGVSLKDFAV